MSVPSCSLFANACVKVSRVYSFFRGASIEVKRSESTHVLSHINARKSTGLKERVNESVSVRIPNERAVARRGVISTLIFINKLAIKDDVAEYSGRRKATSAETGLSELW